MARSEDMFLHEELLLLALHDQKGTTPMGSMYNFSIAGAITSELSLNQRISVDDSKKRLVALISGQPVGDPLIDECLAQIDAAKKPASLQEWISRFSNLKHLKDRIARQLCDKDILRGDREKVLLIFSRKIYPEINPEPERRIIGRLRDAIFSDSHNVDPRTVILIALAETADLLKRVFDRQELKSRKARIEEIASGELMDSATQDAIAAMQAAIASTVVISTVVTSTAAS